MNFFFAVLSCVVALSRPQSVLIEGMSAGDTKTVQVDEFQCALLAADGNRKPSEAGIRMGNQKYMFVAKDDTIKAWRWWCCSRQDQYRSDYRLQREGQAHQRPQGSLDRRCLRPTGCRYVQLP